MARVWFENGGDAPIFASWAHVSEGLLLLSRKRLRNDWSCPFDDCFCAIKWRN